MAPTESSRIWQGRPILGRALQLVIVLVPFLLATLVTLAISGGLGVPTTRGGQAAKIILLVSVAAVVMLSSDRVAKLATPITLLLRIAMVFPDHAPSRVRVAMRCSSEEELRKTLLDVNSNGLGATANDAAETLMVLVAALSRHDRMTKGHSERTRAYADVIAGEMGLSTEDRSKLRWAALLHDVGKMRIPEAILNKPGRLSDVEYEIVKQHAAIGAELVEPLREFLGPWAETVVQHHERWDGGGYPAGISGEQICLGARIVAVADTFDVITSVRSYKKPRTASAARIEIAKHAGTQFDPEVVRIFLGISVGRFGWTVAPLSLLTQVPQFVALFSPVAGGLTTVANVAPAVVLAAGTIGGLAMTTDTYGADIPVDIVGFEEQIAVPELGTVVLGGSTIVTSVAGSSVQSPETTAQTVSVASSTPSSTLVASTAPASGEGPSRTQPPTSSSRTTVPVPVPTTAVPTTAVPTTAVPPTTPAPTTTALPPIVPRPPDGQLPEIFGTCIGQRGITAAQARSAGWLDFDGCQLAADGPLDLAGFDLSGIQVQGGNWAATNFANAKLEDAEFQNLALWDADFSGVDADNLSLTDFAMTNATFAGANLEGAEFVRGDLGLTSFAEANLSDVQVIDSGISGAVFTSASIIDLKLVRVEAYRTSFADSTISDAELVDVNLTEAVFDGASLTDVKMEVAEVTNTSFVGADLTDVSFLDAYGIALLGTTGDWEDVICNDGSAPDTRFCPWS